MSADICWAVLRNSSSFLVKRNGVVLSREPGNLTNKNAFKYSGLAGPRSVDIQKSDKGIVVTLKKKNAANKPSASTTTTTISRPLRASVKATRNIVRRYRPDLTDVAGARVARLLAAPAQPKTKKVRGKKAQ